MIQQKVRAENSTRNHKQLARIWCLSLAVTIIDVYRFLFVNNLRRWRGAKVSFPTVLVSDIAGHALANLPPESTIRFTPSQDVTMAAWDEIGHLKEVSAWPADTQKRQRMYETLVAGNTAFPDRTSAVRAAFSAVSGGDRGGAAGRAVETGRDDAEWQDAVNSDATSASI